MLLTLSWMFEVKKETKDVYKNKKNEEEQEEDVGVEEEEDEISLIS